MTGALTLYLRREQRFLRQWPSNYTLSITAPTITTSHTTATATKLTTTSNITIISFLPSADEGHVYQAAPYEDMCSADFAKWNKKYSKIELTWDNLIEHVDDTTGSQEYACVAGACEI